VNVLFLVAIGGPLLIVVVAVFDVWCLFQDRLTPGQAIQFWSRDHPFLGAMLAAFIGAFAAHIFWHT
jgi:hypothetical protein